jgi:hypothetical protein
VVHEGPFVSVASPIDAWAHSRRRGNGEQSGNPPGGETLLGTSSHLLALMGCL